MKTQTPTQGINGQMHAVLYPKPKRLRGLDWLTDLLKKAFSS
jgi:hypothetical protein